MRKVTDNGEIDKVFAYAYSMRLTSTNVLTGRSETVAAITAAAARHLFDAKRPHSGMWEIAPMKFAFTWEGSEKLPDRERHRVEILCTGVPE